MGCLLPGNAIILPWKEPLFQKKVAVKCKKTVGSNVINMDNQCKPEAMMLASMAEAQPSLSKETTLICVTRI